MRKIALEIVSECDIFKIVSTEVIIISFIMSGQGTLIPMKRLFIFCSSFFFLFLLTGSVSGEEEWDKVLERLIEQKQFDTAEEYLESLRQRGNVPPDLQDQLDFQLGRVAFLSVGNSKDDMAQLGKSRKCLSRFLQEHPDHAQAHLARDALVRMIIKEGEIASAKATVSGIQEPDKLQLVSQARDDFAEAQELLKQLLATNRAKSEQLSNEIKEETNNGIKEAKTAEREKVNFQYVDFRILLIDTAAQTAKTFPRDSEEFKTGLEKAADEFHKLTVTYEKYPGISFLAKFHEAKVWFDLKELEKSKQLLLELTGIGIEFQQLRTGVLFVLLEINEREKNSTDSLKRIVAWERDSLPADRHSFQGQRLLLWGVKAALEISRDPSQKKETVDSAKRIARVYLDSLLNPNHNSPFRLEAEKIQAQLEGKTTRQVSEAKTTGNRPEKLLSFEEGVEWVRKLVDDCEDMLAEYEEEHDSEAKESLKQQLESLYDHGIADIKATLLLRDPKNRKNDQEDVFFLLVQQGYFYWSKQCYEDASVLFEYAADRYQDLPQAPAAIENAVKATRMLVMSERNENRDVSDLLERMKSLIQWGMKRWKENLAVSDLVFLLLDAYVETGNLDAAVAIVDRLPQGGESRKNAEIRVAINLWGSYLNKLRLEESVRPPQEELEKIKTTAKKLLDHAIPEYVKFYQRTGEEPEPVVLYAVRYYAQYFLREENDPKTALSWLENDTIGPVTFINRRAGTVSSDEFRTETLMELLQAQVGANQLDAAEKTMQQLETFIADESSDSSTRLVAVYYYLGKQLEEQLNQLALTGKTAEAQNVSEGFNMFLTRITGREQGNTYMTLSWAADTFFRLGKGLLHSVDSKQREDAKNYLSQATKTYLNICEHLLADPQWGPKDAYRLMTLRLSECLRVRNGPDDCKTALTKVAKLLKENENYIDLQIEAANVYQAWAQDPKFSNYYVRAITGGLPKPDGNNLVWGWNGIIRTVSSSRQFDQFKDFFYEANYNKGMARVLLAKTKSGDEQKELLRGAESELMRLHQTRPDLGGDEWFAKFQAFLITVRKLLGDQSPQGF